MCVSELVKESLQSLIAGNKVIFNIAIGKKKAEKMKTKMYVTPEMEVERFEEEVVITVVSNGMSTETDDISEKTDISGAGKDIGW